MPVCFCFCPVVASRGHGRGVSASPVHVLWQLTTACGSTLLLIPLNSRRSARAGWLPHDAHTLPPPLSIHSHVCPPSGPSTVPSPNHRQFPGHVASVHGSCCSVVGVLSMAPGTGGAAARPVKQQHLPRPPARCPHVGGSRPRGGLRKRASSAPCGAWRAGLGLVVSVVDPLRVAPPLPPRLWFHGCNRGGVEPRAHAPGTSAERGTRRCAAPRRRTSPPPRRPTAVRR